jgi:hypothetical protein
MHCLVPGDRFAIGTIQLRAVLMGCAWHSRFCVVAFGVGSKWVKLRDEKMDCGLEIVLATISKLTTHATTYPPEYRRL